MAGLQVSVDSVLAAQVRPLRLTPQPPLQSVGGRPRRVRERHVDVIVNSERGAGGEERGLGRARQGPGAGVSVLSYVGQFGRSPGSREQPVKPGAEVGESGCRSSSAPSGHP